MLGDLQGACAQEKADTEYTYGTTILLWDGVLTCFALLINKTIINGVVMAQCVYLR